MCVGVSVYEGVSASVGRRVWLYARQVCASFGELARRRRLRQPCVTPIDIIIIIIQLFTSSDTGNKIYFVSAAVRQMLAADGRGQLHTVHAGVKVFEKNPTKNDTFDYRLRQV